MDFAPYQDSPERTRALSPPLPSRRSLSYTPPPPPPPAAPHQNSPSTYQQTTYHSSHLSTTLPFWRTFHTSRPELDDFKTSLGIRVDLEACLAYAVLPPAGALFLLLVERKSDFVRFHAWQSTLLFSALFILQMIFIWSAFMFWLICVVDIGAMVFLILKAYRDADTLDRFEIPYIGSLAMRFVGDE